MFKVVWLNGMPRSGTSWLAQIFDSSESVNFRMAPLFSYEFKNAVGANSTDNEWLSFFESINNSTSDFLTQKQRKAAGLFESFHKKENLEVLCIKDVRNHQVISRMLELPIDLKIVHIVRNPCAAISSWMNSEKEFHIDKNSSKDEWKTGEHRKNGPGEYWGFNDWIDLTKKYLNLELSHPDKVKVVRFEDLVLDKFNKVKELFDFCNISYSNQVQEFLIKSHSSHNDNDYSVFKNPKEVLTRWQKELDEDIVNAIVLETNRNGLGEFL